MVGSRGFTLRVLTRVQIGTITLQNNLPLSSDIESTHAHSASVASLSGAHPGESPVSGDRKGGELVQESLSEQNTGNVHQE